MKIYESRKKNIFNKFILYNKFKKFFSKFLAKIYQTNIFLTFRMVLDTENIIFIFQRYISSNFQHFLHFIKNF